MAPDLQLVEERLRDAATVDFPIVSSLIRDIVKGGGKRLRPLLLLLAAKSFTYDLDRAVTAAAGVELLHTASLVHDDHIDRAALRRGQPTLNTQLSSGAVILIGDYLFAQSAILAAATNNARVVTIFATSLAEICDGQIRETLDAHRLTQDREDYNRRIYGKTAALFAGAAEMGAVIGRAESHEVQELRHFGAELGMAFQVVDDILDLREGTQKLGKPAGNDLRQGVVTLPTMLFLESASPQTAETLERIVTGDEISDDVMNDIVDQIRASDALDRAESSANDYIIQAESRLDVVKDQVTRGFLRDLLHMSIVRSA
jgi:geranylgeranyl pyrophosphate synthase